MARNLIQFKLGLSLLLALLELHRNKSKTQCHKLFLKSQWLNSSVCSDCKKTKALLPYRGIYQWHRYYHQALFTINTIFYAIYLPLTTFFLKIYLLIQRKNSLSELKLSRKLSIIHNTAWKIQHKMLQIMFKLKQGYKLYWIYPN